jgi:hypothetical protein
MILISPGSLTVWLHFAGGVGVLTRPLGRLSSCVRDLSGHGLIPSMLLFGYQENKRGSERPLEADTQQSRSVSSVCVLKQATGPAQSPKAGEGSAFWWEHGVVTIHSAGPRVGADLPGSLKSGLTNLTALKTKAQVFCLEKWKDKSQTRRRYL